MQGWGGPGAGYEWPDNEHGMFVDYKENVWVGGNGPKDTNILKFTKDGKFLLQIGHHGKSGGSNDTENLNRPAGFVVYPKTNEVFVADGYGNRRVIVYDADTGAYKRHWGAYGKKPDDQESNARTFEGDGPKQFNTVHAIRISNDDLVYVGDRRNNRIQVFKPDGTYLKEAYVERKTIGEEGTTFDFAFSPDRAAAIHVHPGRDQQEGPDSEPADARGGGIFRRPRRAWSRAVLPHPQHRHGFEGKHLFGRVVRKAGAEVELQGNGESMSSRKTAAATAVVFLLAAWIVAAQQPRRVDDNVLKSAEKRAKSG